MRDSGSGQGDPGETTVLGGGDPGETTVLDGGDAGETSVLDGRADPSQTTVVADEDAEATTVIAPGEDATQVIGSEAMPEAAFAPRRYIPEQAVNPEMMPDSAFAPRSAAYSPSATSVLPAEVIAEQRRRNQRNAGQGARYAAGSFASADDAYEPARPPQHVDARACGRGAGGARPKKGHGCLVAFITVVVVLVLLALAAMFALDYVSQNTGVAKDEILARLASPVRKFIDGLTGK